MMDYTVTSIETVTAFDLTTGAYMFTMDELQDATIAQGEEVTDITGKNGRKLSSLKRNKTVTISGTNGLLSNGLMELQTGSAFENTVTEVLWTDYLTVKNSAAATEYKAVGTTGNEIEAVYVKTASGAASQKLTQGAAASDGVFTYNPEDKTLGFSGIADGTEIVVFYKRKIQADVHTNKSDSYSGKCMLYIDVLAEDKCGNVYHGQFFIPKADFKGEFNIEMSDSQSVHAFEAESLAGACGAGGNLWTYTIFGVNAEDAA